VLGTATALAADTLVRRWAPVSTTN
jgi:hypothetical protein